MTANANEISWDVQMDKAKSSHAQTFPEWSLYFEVNCHLMLFLLTSVEMLFVFRTNQNYFLLMMGVLGLELMLPVFFCY
jgi:hypothetical protein